LRDFVEFWQVGNHTFTVPSGVSRIMVEVWGGSGGGGGAAACGGGGGGAGGFLRVILNVSPGEPFNIHVGNGGAGGASEVIFVSGAWYGANADNSFVQGNWQSGHALAFGGGGGQIGNCQGPAVGGGWDLTFATVAQLGRAGEWGERSLTSGIPSPGGALPFAHTRGGGRGAINLGENGQAGTDGNVVISW
jgi:hypothetical protein